MRLADVAQVMAGPGAREFLVEVVLFQGPVLQRAEDGHAVGTFWPNCVPLTIYSTVYYVIDCPIIPFPIFFLMFKSS